MALSCGAQALDGVDVACRELVLSSPLESTQVDQRHGDIVETALLEIAVDRADASPPTRERPPAGLRRARTGPRARRPGAGSFLAPTAPPRLYAPLSARNHGYVTALSEDASRWTRRSAHPANPTEAPAPLSSTAPRAGLRRLPDQGPQGSLATAAWLWLHHNANVLSQRVQKAVQAFHGVPRQSAAREV